ATGGTLIAATHYLAERGAKDVTAINIIAAPEGLDRLREEIDPSIDFKVVVCAVDEKLNEKSYIVPGLGDAGDRLYGVID
ncbi:MAG: uracil phosphoribosyltransferase, partial [Bifidobacterium crudilactis]|nr:uracil phosphoribosyltransferase [Bifidobacterium crudilactis]